MKVLIVGAHPDDETFSMGGTLAKHIADGDEVRVLVLADGVTARNGDTQKQRDSLDRAMFIYGVKNYLHLAFPDQQMDHEPLLSIVQAAEDAINDFRPERVYTHSPADVGQDHRRVSEAVMVAARPPSGVKEILFFPSPSSTFWGNAAWKPNYFVDVTEYIKVRNTVLVQAYPHETPVACHPRSIMALHERARWTGNMLGKDGFFEEFEMVRCIRD